LLLSSNEGPPGRRPLGAGSYRVTDRIAYDAPAPRGLDLRVCGHALVSKPERAARLLGAAAALREVLGAPVPAREREDHDRAVAALRTALGETAFAEDWTAGEALPVEKAVAEALTLPNERPVRGGG
jgi:hypothetical protein